MRIFRIEIAVQYNTRSDREEIVTMTTDAESLKDADAAAKNLWDAFAKQKDKENWFYDRTVEVVEIHFPIVKADLPY